MAVRILSSAPPDLWFQFLDFVLYRGFSRPRYAVAVASPEGVKDHSVLNCIKQTTHSSTSCYDKRMSENSTDKTRFFTMLERAVNPPSTKASRKDAKNRDHDNCSETGTPQGKKKGTSGKQRGTSHQSNA